MNKISINIIENRAQLSGVSFKSLFTKEPVLHDVEDKVNLYEITKGEETLQFHFFKDTSNTPVTIQPLSNYFSFYQQPGSGVVNTSEEAYNFILYINLSVSDKSTREMEYEELIKLFVKERTNRFKLLIVAVNYNFMVLRAGNRCEIKEYECNELTRLKAFHEQVLSHAHVETKLINISPFSNKKYQIDYILNIACSTFSNYFIDLSSRMNEYSKIDGILELSSGNDSMVIQDIVNHIINNQTVMTPLEMYIKLSTVEYSSVIQILEKSIETLVYALIEASDKFYDLSPEFQTLYNNYYSLYVVSKIENNFAVSNWLSDQVIYKTERKRQEIEKTRHILRDKICSADKLLSRIALGGYPDIFKYQFELDEIQDINQNQPNKSFKSLFISGSVFYIYSLNELKHSFDTIRWLMEEKCKSFDNELNLFWQTNILLKSAYDNNLEVFKYILNHENSVVQVDSCIDDYSSIHLASSRGHLDILKYIRQEKDFNLNNSKSLKNGLHAIHCAAEEHQQEVVDFLMQSGANIESTDKEGATPLYYACRKYHFYHHIWKDKFQLPFCKYLLKRYGAKTTIELNGKKFSVKDEFLGKNCIIM